MGSLWGAKDREEIRLRLGRLSPDSRPRWGSMSAGRMLCHVADQLRAAIGELELGPAAGPRALRTPPFKQLVLYWLPWPKGKVKAPRGVLGTASTEWEEDLARLEALIERFPERDRGGTWPAHPLFGKMSGRAWGVLGYRHLDHHLRQFGA